MLRTERFPSGLATWGTDSQGKDPPELENVRPARRFREPERPAHHLVEWVIALPGYNRFSLVRLDPALIRGKGRVVAM